MNLFLRPLVDVNDITWSIVVSLIILLAGVTYYIYTIMKLAFGELEDVRTDQSKGRRSGSDDSTLDPQD